MTPCGWRTQSPLQLIREIYKGQETEDIPEHEEASRPTRDRRRTVRRRKLLKVTAGGALRWIASQVRQRIVAQLSTPGALLPSAISITRFASLSRMAGAFSWSIGPSLCKVAQAPSKASYGRKLVTAVASSMATPIRRPASRSGSSSEGSLAEGDAGSAMLLALEGLPDSRNGIDRKQA
jgi:hypothetical protein